jgi:hypothetical protein
MEARDELILVLWLSLILIAFAFPLTMAESPAARNTTDTSSPRILDFDFSPRELIIEEASSQITLQTHVADENNDINFIEAVFLSPSQNQSKIAFMNSTNLFSGDAKNGNYTINMSFSPSNEGGIWTLYHLTVCNKSGDCRRLDGTRAETLEFPTRLLILKKAQNGSLMSQSNSSALQGSKEIPAQQTLDLDPNELRGWANTDKSFTAQRKIIINSVFNRPAMCWP